MIRFPNPGSNIQTFITIFKTLYSSLSNCNEFSLDDISSTLTSKNLAASCGYVGDTALKLSTRKDRSKDPLYNQSKMYAELFRSLGWISSASNKALIYKFTLLGEYVAASKENSLDIFEECILGINFPNQILSTQFTESSRVFATILHVAKKLGGYILRDEIILGPLSTSDTSRESINNMVNKIKKCRGDYDRLSEEIKLLSESTGIQINTLRNYTRFPLAVLINCGWFEKTKGHCYPNKGELHLTQKGIEREIELQNCMDIRLDDYKVMSYSKQSALIRIGFYSMLRRANYDIAQVSESIENDYSLYFKSEKRDLLFSPYQTIIKSDVDKILCAEQQSSYGLNSTPSSKYKASVTTPINNDLVNWDKANTLIQLTQSFLKTQITCPNNSNIVSEFEILFRYTESVSDVVNQLFSKYITAKKEVFYPLIADLFCILGFNCTCMRNGINYERWDAIIIDELHSIPIEIKSPTEEEFISIKAVRQALENKIILLSRNIHKTEWGITSLVVGYNLPNERAEVQRLIVDIKKTFNIEIGVIDFHSLLLLAAQKIRFNKSISRESLEKLMGLINVRDS